MELTEELIRSRLADCGPKRLQGEHVGEAAVLMALQGLEQEPCFVLTRRTDTVATHKGQISFPGGVREPGDESLTCTALREMEEEIGVPPGQVEVLGEFHDYWAVTDHLVRAIVGVIPEGSHFQPHSSEVAYVLQIPLEFFRTAVPEVRPRRHRGEVRQIYYFDFHGESVWGLTARMIKDFVDLIEE